MRGPEQWKGRKVTIAEDRSSETFGCNEKETGTPGGEGEDTGVCVLTLTCLGREKREAA